MRFPALLAAILTLAGCGGSYSGVQAIAPSVQDEMVGTAPSSGEFTLYRATGYVDGNEQQIEPIWTVSASAGQKLGFRWYTVPSERYSPEYGGTGGNGFHLVAYAGNESRDLGSFKQRDLKYVWAGSHGDVAGYFRNKLSSDTINVLTMH
jgi:hypothetical protein